MNMTLFEATTNHLYRHEAYPGEVPEHINKMSNWEFLQAISEALDDVLVQYQDRRLIQRRVAPTTAMLEAKQEHAAAMVELTKKFHEDYAAQAANAQRSDHVL